MTWENPKQWTVWGPPATTLTEALAILTKIMKLLMNEWRGNTMGGILSNPKKKAIRLKGKAYTEFKRRMYKRANECCETCGKWVPLTDYDGHFDVFTCAHLSHIKPRKKYGDVSGNVKIECFNCHIAEGHLKWRSDKKEHR